MTEQQYTLEEKVVIVTNEIAGRFNLEDVFNALKEKGWADNVTMPDLYDAIVEIYGKPEVEAHGKPTE